LCRQPIKVELFGDVFRYPVRYLSKLVARQRWATPKAFGALDRFGIVSSKMDGDRLRDTLQEKGGSRVGASDHRAIVP